MILDKMDQNELEHTKTVNWMNMDETEQNWMKCTKM